MFRTNKLNHFFHPQNWEERRNKRGEREREERERQEKEETKKRKKEERGRAMAMFLSRVRRFLVDACTMAYRVERCGAVGVLVTTMAAPPVWPTSRWVHHELHPQSLEW